MIDSVIERAPVFAFVLSLVLFALSVFYAFAPNTFIVSSTNKVSTISPIEVVSVPATGNFELAGYQLADKFAVTNPVLVQE